MNDIKALLRRSRVRQYEVAKACNRSPSAVSQWFTGARPIPAECAQPISNLTGIPLYVLRPDLWTEPKRRAKASA